MEAKCLEHFANDFEKHYAGMSDEELAALKKEDLTATARERYEREVGRRGVPATSDPVFSSALPPAQTPRASKVLVIAGIVVGVLLVGGYLAMSVLERSAASSYLDNRQADLKLLEHSENLMAQLGATMLNALSAGGCQATASEVADFTRTVGQEEKLVAAAQPLLDFERGHPDTWPSAVQSVASNRERLGQLENGIDEKLRVLRQENALARRALAACVPAR